jgi:hypothetical protein
MFPRVPEQDRQVNDAGTLREADMETEDGRAAARRAVGAQMSERGWNPADLAKAAGIDPGTVGDFLSGARWPKQRTQGRIEKALDWAPGTLMAIATGAPAPAVGAGGQDPPGVLLDLPDEALEGLSAVERDEAITAARLALLAKAREIRNR